MTSAKNILVTTASLVQGTEIQQHLKPVSAHIVAGTNFFSDVFASFSDVFGGRSKSYQNQLSSLYNEAIEKLKLEAYELGANCIIGLSVDLDEISGKGKSMFMVTAIGSAVIINDINSLGKLNEANEKVENISLDKIKTLRQKREIIEQANSGKLNLDDETWNFITLNKVSEVFDFVLIELKKNIRFTETKDFFYKKTVDYLDSLPEEKKLSFLYDSVSKEDDEQLVLKLCSAIEELQLLDFNYIEKVLKNEDFQKQKRGLRMITYDKPFYNKQDIEKLNSLTEFIKIRFPEQGKRFMKKQLLSSKEKEVWTCDCNSTVETGKYCGNCKKDIYGFTSSEISPPQALENIEEKISLISGYIY